MVSTKCRFHHHSGQLVPSQLGPARQQWWLVQPSQGALRHVPARLGADWYPQRCHCPSSVKKGAVSKERRRSLHYEWEPLLQPVQTNGSWQRTTHNWGQNWELREQMQGQALSFITTTEGARPLTSSDAVDSVWRFGQTFEGSQY